MKRFCKKCRTLITGRELFCVDCGLDIIKNNKQMDEEQKEGEEIKEEPETPVEETEEGEEISENLEKEETKEEVV